GRGEGDKMPSAHPWSEAAEPGTSERGETKSSHRPSPWPSPIREREERWTFSFLQRRLTVARRAVHRILVEARNHMLAEQLRRVQRGRLRLAGSEDAEDDLIATDIDVVLHRLGAFVRVADDALPRLDALFQLLERRLRNHLRPLRHAGRAREGIQVP